MYYKQASKKSGGAENYLCETLVKRNIHQGDIYALACCDMYVAAGGVDGRVSFWNV
jgi:hypothetical protein